VVFLGLFWFILAPLVVILSNFANF